VVYLEGTTIVVGTPYMDEADRCSRVGLMYQGCLLVCRKPQEIRDQIEGDLIELLADDWQAAHSVVGSLPGVLEVQTYGEALHLLVDSTRLSIPAIESKLRGNGCSYRSIRHATPRMEQAFISLIRQVESEET
jgi:ABC-2 type transport system ATP-binding protein